ncbi:MAG: tetratricopeptide repeat protein [Myxococcota bacterium]|jgi:hypothetical protein|nr:tetratricopeptide repeat protein [Myxococcota bacterium]
MRLALILFTSLLCGTVLSAAAVANPCEKLSPEQDQRYRALVEEGTQAAHQRDFDTAIARFQAALEICAFDPAVTYSLARSHDLAGDCRTAITLYTQAKAQLSGALIESELNANTVDTRLAAAEQVCASNAELELSCDQEGIWIRIDEQDPIACPWRGKILAGRHRIEAGKDGFGSFNDEFEVQGASLARVVIPKLSPSSGFVQLLCADTQTQVTISGTPRDCDTTFSLSPGAHTLLASREGYQSMELQLNIEAALTQTVHLPKLASSGPAPATLNLQCPEQIAIVNLVGAGRVDTVPCPQSLSLAPGQYTITVPHLDIVEKVELISEQTSTLVLQPKLAPTPQPKAEEEGSSNTAGGIVFAAGVLLAGGGVASYVISEEVDLSDDSARLASGLGIVGMSVGGITLITGIVLMAVLEDDPAVAVSFAPDYTGLSWSMQF